MQTLKMAAKKIYSSPNPRANCNFLKALTFTWTWSIFRLGHQRDIQDDDIWEPLTEHASGEVGETFSEAWDKKKNEGVNPNLCRLLFKHFRREIIFYFLVTLVRECVVRVSQPVFLGFVMSHYDKDGTPVAGFSLHWISLVGSYLLYILMTHPCAMGVSHLGLKYRVAVGSLIYRKSLRLSQCAFVKTTVGQMVNLLSNDMRRFDYGTVLMNYLIIAPIQFSIAIYFIYQEIGPSSLSGAGVLILLIPLQLWISSRVSVLLTQAVKLTDKRVQLTHEVINGIQLIKMYTLEEKFSQLLCSARREEIDKIKQISYLRGVTTSFRMFNTRLCVFISILTYVLLGNEITTKKLFVTVCFYEILKQTMTSWFPDALNLCKEMSATLKRIEEFLSRDDVETRPPLPDKINEKFSRDVTEECEMPLIPRNKFELVKLKSQPISDNTQDEEMQQIIKAENQLEKKEYAIIIKELSAKWDSKQEHTLKNISLNIAQGSFVVIYGSVGSGKSSLLYALLRELPSVTGYIKPIENVSYASQDPWLFSGTIKENILFGSTIDDDRYRKVWKACALETDKLLGLDDETNIGERGTTLSGGQRARVSLARAVYREADVYLLDDPLSAVDAEVGKDILHGIREMLKGKTVLLVTHQLYYAKKGDIIIKLEKGEIVSQRMNNSEEDLSNISDLGDSKKSKEEEKVLKIDRSAVNPKTEESLRTGNVKWEVYIGYASSSGSVAFISILLALSILTQILASGFDYWNKYWVNIEENVFSSNALSDSVKNTRLNDSYYEMDDDSSITPVIHNMTKPFTVSSHNITSVNNSQNITFSAQMMEELYLNRSVYIAIYAIIVILLVIVTLSRSILFYRQAMKASVKSHDDMLRSIMKAKMAFFHSNPPGRIINRFSQDIGFMDDLLPLLILDVLQMFFQLVGISVIVSVVNYWSIIAIFSILLIIYFIRKYYIKSSRSVKRLEGINKSPVFSHLTASMQGVVTIRAMKAEKQVIREFDKHQDLYTSTSFMCMGTSRAFAYVLDLSIVIFIVFVILSFTLIEGNIEGNIGLAVTQVIGLATMFQWGMRQFTVLENQMINVERIEDYIKLDHEPSPETGDERSKDRKKEPKNWPSDGKIEFKNVNLNYTESEKLPSLRGISFLISAGNKIGVVGRTGSGKTSLINALFRLAQVDGEIEIDGVDTAAVGLHTLRRQISIIPQQPVLFSGTLKDNLDPFDKFSDHDIWSALEQVELKQMILIKSGKEKEEDNGLHCRIAEGGSNFSVGERQLLCLARALLQRNKIIILDEATASIDIETDALIQRTILEKFSKCTIITVAHRLQTVMNSDKILVMHAGRMLEYDSRKKLLQDENSEFSKMVAQAGITREEALKNLTDSVIDGRVEENNSAEKNNE